MSDLRPLLASTLQDLFPGARHESLVADASTRRFHRLFLPGGATLIVMDYGEPFDGETDDIRLARIFERARLPVAHVIRSLPVAGALIVEDLGDDTLECALGKAASGTRPLRDELYLSAVQLAAKIATQGTEALSRSERAKGPALDGERFLFEMRFFLEHYVGNFLGRREIAPEIQEAVETLALTAAAHPRVLCHRDFHSRNIMVRGDGSLAMVDIQDARWGPDTYDLASLLCDAYVDLGDEEHAGLFSQYLKQLSETSDIDAFRIRYDVIAAQRMIKALGTFGYQISVLHRERYRSAVPRTVERLSRLLEAREPVASLGKVMLREGLLIP